MHTLFTAIVVRAAALATATAGHLSSATGTAAGWVLDNGARVAVPAAGALAVLAAAVTAAVVISRRARG